MKTEHKADVAAILGRRHHNGGDFWATPDGRVYVGSPFSTLGALGILHELRLRRTHEAVRGGLALIWAAWRDDGRIRLAPSAPLYPCYTAEAARVLCRYGYSKDQRVQRTAKYLLEEAHETGGWRCNFTKFGRGPETRVANPGATLFALDVLRFTGHARARSVVDRAVESLLAHWETRLRCGPCHYGIGSRFMQVEYPFLRYNLFYYVYVLSHFPRAVTDTRFRAAAEALRSCLDADGRVIVQAPHRGLKGLKFCERGKPSDVATSRYREIVANVGAPPNQRLQPTTARRKPKADKSSTRRPRRRG